MRPALRAMGEGAEALTIQRLHVDIPASHPAASALPP